ncbi:unnamed protein product [Trichogramma brassicae]|uniref:Uncharacterized protein n=1 Tax=Trichogramma brassicae TaxID=86971 RepID=A0A6H5J3P0_9HYME|nr:unnamed protein product [Trichogramma brassicae]
MKKIVDDCHDKYKKFCDRSTITATGLRKFIATSYKNKTKGQYSKELMRHLAHDENTHDKAYRKVTAQETAKITAILEEIIIDAGKNTEKGAPETNDQLPALPKSTEIPQQLQTYNYNDLEINNNDTEIEDEVETFTESLPKTKTRRSWKRDDIDDFENAFNIEINQGVSI